MRGGRGNKHRKLGFEGLEGRIYLSAAAGVCHVTTDTQLEPASVTSPWQNQDCPTDVNADGSVTPRDALHVLNFLNDRGVQPVGEGEGGVPQGGPYLDVTGDRLVSPRDALWVILALNAEGEGSTSPIAPIMPPPLPDPPPDPTQLTPDEVRTLLRRAAAASASDDAIIAVVDRGGTILGVRVESDVLAAITDTETLVFAIDGAVAKARTAAYFANNQAPLTSRTIRNISQSTVTQRAVESNPNITDPDSPLRGPGTVAPIGLGGHFPPGVQHTPHVDLFDIENTNRDSLLHPGPDGIKGTADDLLLPARFNISPAHIPPDVYIPAPESYGYQSGVFPEAQARGIATLPGGIPLYKDGIMVGGIGVFFPGDDGYATHEQGFAPLPEDATPEQVARAERARTNAPRVLEAEWIAYAAAGGSTAVGFPVGELGGVPALPGFDLPDGRLDLVGITLEVFGPNPTTDNPVTGIQTLKKVAAAVGRGDPDSGADQKVESDGTLYRQGQALPEGWLVTPHASADLTADEVEAIILRAVDAASRVRAGIRLPLGSRARMVFAVSDLNGEILGLYRMPDATYFSVGVAVAKARNMAYYADASSVAPEDLVAGVPAGTAMTNRTFRFLAEPRFPSGVDGSEPPPFSILNDGLSDTQRINPKTAENIGPPLPASAFTSVLGFNTFNPGQNFRDPNDPYNQNGIVFFPGAVPLYKDGKLVGGLGVSGDGVDQDDVVTVDAAQGFLPPAEVRADRFSVRGVRLPFLKSLRNPFG